MGQYIAVAGLRVVGFSTVIGNQCSVWVIRRTYQWHAHAYGTCCSNYGWKLEETSIFRLPTSGFFSSEALKKIHAPVLCPHEPDSPTERLVKTCPYDTFRRAQALAVKIKYDKVGLEIY